jgi:hypothetical protein
LAKIKKDIAAGEKVIVDCSGLVDDDVHALKEAVNAAGLSAKVVFYE